MSPAVEIRSIEPTDKQVLLGGFERLSDRSRYRRFLAPQGRLSARELRYFTEVDHHDHEALVAIDPATGEGVGVARYVRSERDPASAELAIAVVDDWQRRGVGSRLTSALVERARAEGISRFTAILLAENDDMLRLLEDLGRVRILRRERGTIEASAEFPVGALERLRGILRRVGSDELRALAPWHLARRAWETAGIAGDKCEITQALGPFSSVSLSKLDERASLMRRVDNKYAVPHEALLELLKRLSGDHDVLDMDGRREFACQTVYFESPKLRCFWDHVDGRFPRFKARTRLYEDTGACVFEVKLKGGDGETDKRQVDHPAERANELTDSARECLDGALDAGGIELDERLEPRLRTNFRRITLAARENPERLTCDLGLRLSAPSGAAVSMASELVLVETKSESGESPADQLLGELGLEQISLSKYRVGMSLVGGAEVQEAQPGSEYFS